MFLVIDYWLELVSRNLRDISSKSWEVVTSKVSQWSRESWPLVVFASCFTEVGWNFSVCNCCIHLLLKQTAIKNDLKYDALKNWTECYWAFNNLWPGTPCFRGYGRRNGERRRKSVRGCIVSQDLSVLNLVIVKKGEHDLPGLTDSEKPRMRGPKRASKIRKLFNLSKEDDVRKYVNTYRRSFTTKSGKDPYALVILF